MVAVLHANAGSRKPTGHLGSAITKKAETVAYVQKDLDIVTVTPDFTRNYGWEEFTFQVNEDALPYLTSENQENPF